MELIIGVGAEASQIWE